MRLHRSVVFLCLLFSVAFAARVDLHAGGVCLLYRDDALVQSWPGGYPPSVDELAVEEGDGLRLLHMSGTTEEQLACLLEILSVFGEVEVRESDIVVAPFDDTAIESSIETDTAAWVVEAGDDVPVEHLVQAVRYLRAKGPFVRQGWLQFVGGRTLALTGWGAVEVVFEDGALMHTRYQAYDSPAHRLLVERGVMGADEEYAEHPEADGIAEWLVAEGRSTLYEGDFTIVVAYRWE